MLPATSSSIKQLCPDQLFCNGGYVREYITGKVSRIIITGSKWAPEGLTNVSLAVPDAGVWLLTLPVRCLEAQQISKTLL